MKTSDKKELKRLKSKLYGYYQVVADRAGVQKGMVSMVLNGEALSQKVLDAAYEVELLSDTIKEKARSEAAK